MLLLNMTRTRALTSRDKGSRESSDRSGLGGRQRSDDGRANEAEHVVVL